ncbi:cytochrome c oxidase assembly protein [Solimonas marina]|uniref:Cytochrome c oxidase assembly protein n=1 Tax=Solimonas marina TaxID=2714601 RepID=A0A969WBE6_9GAMM|nr:cytochrome c oxidase assembly protein [Solimonas marina]NKF24077.1 cytochrome c oxidase assembly protein [Solimonas marina]
MNAIAMATRGRAAAWPRRSILVILSVLAVAIGTAWLWSPARPWLEALLPWEFSPTVLAAAVAALWLFLRGVARARRFGLTVGRWRQISYCGAVLLLYFAMQSRLDYYAQHMFWIHRVQHLLLHHLGPFFMMLAAPQRLIVLGMPRTLRRRAYAPLRRNPVVRALLRVVLHPLLAPILFVGGIAIWLIPAMHFDVMLSLPLYQMMNWSMILDGLPFWALMLDRRPSPPAALGFSGRLITLWVVMIAQILIGAVIGLARHDLYPVYAICGRAFALGPLVDQELGGLVVWIPGAMMSVIATVVVLGLYREAPRRAATLNRPLPTRP